MASGKITVTNNSTKIILILLQNVSIPAQYPYVVNHKHQSRSYSFDKLLQAINAVDISAQPRYIKLPIGLVRIAAEESSARVARSRHPCL
jgi:hypothetical protein